MNISSCYIGSWTVSPDLLLHKNTNAIGGLEIEGASFASFFNNEDINFLFNASVSTLKEGTRSTILLRKKCLESKNRIFLASISLRSESAAPSVLIEMYSKPGTADFDKDAFSHINIFSAIFRKTPEYFVIYNNRHEAILASDQIHEWAGADELPNAAAMPVDTTTEEYQRELRKSFQEKRFVMLQQKQIKGDEHPVLLIFEPLVNERSEVQFVYLFCYDIVDLNTADIIVLNQFLAIESAMDGIALLNEKGEYTYLNDAHVKIFGYETEQELVGKTWTAIYGPEEIERISNNLFPLLMANGKWSGETKGLSKQGTPVIQDISLTALPNGGLVCVCRDVTQRKRHEKQLELNDRILRNTHSMIIITNANREIEWVNEAFCNMTGYCLEEVIGRRPGDFLQGKDTDKATIIHMSDRLKNNQPFTCETINYTKDGRPYWIEIKCQPLFGPDGKIEKYFAIEEDISYRKQSQLALRKSQLLLETAMEASGNAVWEWDLNTNKITSINLKNLLGYDDNEMITEAQEYLSWVHPEDRMNAAEFINLYTGGNRQYGEHQERIRTKSGEYIWILQRSRAVEWDSEGKPIRVVGSAININPIITMTQQLAASEERWKIALEGSGAGIGEIDINENKVWYSLKAAQLLGFASPDKISTSYDDFLETIHPEDLPGAKDIVNKHLNGETPSFEMEFRMLCKDKSYRWFDFHGIISKRNADGSPKAFIGSAYDITDRKLFEEKLKLSEERWKFAIDGANAGIWDWDIHSNTVYYSDKAKELHGIFEKGNTFPAISYFAEKLLPEDRLRVVEEAYEMISGKADRLESEYRIIHSEKGICWINDRAMVVSRDENGKANRVIGIFFDVTEKKLLDEKLRESEQRWIFALEGSSSGVWDYNLPTGDVFYSRKLKELLGYSADESFENSINTWSKLVHPDDVEMANLQIQKFITGEAPTYENEQRAMHKDGTYHWYLNRAIIADKDENGIATRLIGTVADITNRKKNELELIKAKEMAEGSAKAKRLFLANMSHEIRTPMNAILGLSEQLRSSLLHPDQEFLINIINDAARSLQVLIDDILDFSKIEEGKLSLEYIDFDLHEQVRRIISMLLHKAQEKNISIRMEFDWKIAHIVKGDPNRLSQILINIVGNAIKFTREGYVLVTCRLQETHEKKQLITFTVSDTGVGMTEESLANIFTEFYQEDQSIARKFGGTGLGLSISKNLVELMGGDITIESKKHIGTQVHITIPFEMSEHKYLPFVRIEDAINKKVFKNKKILLVEDNKVNRIVASIILKKMNMKIDEAENGKVALYYTQEHEYDLILMDLQMPEMDGITATRIIRENNIQTPIIALTANAVHDELEELLEKGFNSYLVKPFEEKKLLLKIQEQLETPEDKANVLLERTAPAKKERNSIRKSILLSGGGNEAMLSVLVDALKLELNEALESLQIALATNDAVFIKKIAHKQKSMLLSLDINDESDTIHFLSKMNIHEVSTEEIREKSIRLFNFFTSLKEETYREFPDLVNR